MSGETPGQRLALEELAEIEGLAAGEPPPVRLEAVTGADDGWLLAEVSLDCTDIRAEPGRAMLAGREHALLRIPPEFPFARPAVTVRHTRFAGLPYVLHGHHICLYHSDADWNPAGGMSGVIARLAAWYRRAAQGRLVEEGQPLHPPLAYPLSRNPHCIVVRPDLPTDAAPAAALMIRQASWRADVVQWLRPAAVNLTGGPTVDRLRRQLAEAESAHHGNAFLAAVKILAEPLNFEFPRTFPELAAALSAQGADPADLTRQLAQVWLTNLLAAGGADPPLPLYVMFGAPMRGFAGSGARQTHLAVWQVGMGEAAIPPAHAFRDDPDAWLTTWLPTAQKGALEWLRSAPIAWAEVQEARRQVVTRRDTGRPAQWLLGKTVLVLGCGALGARLAEHCVRAGAGKVIVADGNTVSPGVLVRQPYEEADIGLPKATILALRLAQIRPLPDLDVVAELGDVRQTVLGSESARPDTDLVIDATANRGVSARIEWLRRTQPRRWPPVLTVGVGHECERVLGALALPQATGAGADILQSFADRVTGDETLQDAAEDFFAPPDPRRLFQPEIGCSEPTFTGSDPEAAAAAGLVLSWALLVLRDHAAHRPVPPKSLLLARLPGDRDRPAHVYLDWPNDVIAEDDRSGYQIRIRPQAMAVLRAASFATACLHPPEWETGGILLGHIDDACRVVWVAAAEGPPPDSEHGRYLFRHGTQGVAARIAAHRRRSAGRARFVGMWHTHPGLPPVASAIDYQAMGSLLGPTASQQLPRRAALLVLGGEAGSWNRWLQGTGEPDIGFQLFRRPHSQADRSQAAQEEEH